MDILRSCIDIDPDGDTFQGVGSTLLSDNPITNAKMERRPSEYAVMFKEDNLRGGHVIALPGRSGLSGMVPAGHSFLGGGSIDRDHDPARDTGFFYRIL